MGDDELLQERLRLLRETLDETYDPGERRRLRSEMLDTHRRLDGYSSTDLPPIESQDDGRSGEYQSPGSLEADSSTASDLPQDPPDEAQAIGVESADASAPATWQARKAVKSGSSGSDDSRPLSYNRLSLSGFVLGLVSILLPLGLIPISAVALSVAGLATHRAGQHKARWMGVVGLVLGILYTLVYLNAYGYLAL